MPSNLRSNIQSGPVNRSCVSVAAIGSSHSGKDMGARGASRQSVRRERVAFSPAYTSLSGPAGRTFAEERVDAFLAVVADEVARDGPAGNGVCLAQGHLELTIEHLLAG